MLALTACAAPGPSLRVREIPSPAAAGSAQPDVSLGGDGRAVLSWTEEGGDGTHTLRFSSWQGAAWSAPAIIARGADWFVNWADFPSVTSLDDGTLVAHWLQKTADAPYAYAVMLSRSTDGGRTWSQPMVPHDPSATEHGFVSLVPLEGGRAAIFWLDGRETGGGHEGAGAMTLRAATLGPDGSLQGSDLVDARVCDCCQTSATRLKDGSLAVVYRDRSADEVRDIAVTRFDGSQWSEPALVHEDGWRIPGCPVNGPAIAAQGMQVAVAWFTMGREGKPSVRCAMSGDGGRMFDPPQEVGLGNPIGRVDVALLENGTPVVSWIEKRAEGAEILVRSLGGDPIPIARTSAARSSGFPRIVRVGESVFVAWIDPGTPPRVRTARVEL